VEDLVSLEETKYLLRHSHLHFYKIYTIG